MEIGIVQAIVLIAFLLIMCYPYNKEYRIPFVDKDAEIKYKDIPKLTGIELMVYTRWGNCLNIGDIIITINESGTHDYYIYTGYEETYKLTDRQIDQLEIDYNFKIRI